MGADYELFLELLEKTGKKTSDVAKSYWNKGICVFRLEERTLYA